MSKERLVSAAEMLRKGGTLVSETCGNCKGVQVRYEGKIICVNCGREVVEAKTAEAKTEQQAAPPAASDIRSTIIAKIEEVLPLLREERDVGRQAEIAKLIVSYLDILAKTPEKESKA